MKAKLKRAGVTWPTDKHDNTRRGRPYPHTIQAMDAALAKLGHPAKVKVAELKAALEADPPLGPSAIRSYMLWKGWEARGKTQALTWHAPGQAPAPVDIVEWMDTPPEESVVVAAEEAPAEEAPAEVVPEVPEVPAEAAPEVREFIDTVSSWTVDLASLGDMPLADVVRVLQAAGVVTELRVWRP